jgi:hypothetical protein
MHHSDRRTTWLRIASRASAVRERWRAQCARICMLAACIIARTIATSASDKVQLANELVHVRNTDGADALTAASQTLTTQNFNVFESLQRIAGSLSRSCRKDRSRFLPRRCNDL